VYIPIDISAEAVSSLEERFRASLPGIQMEPQIGDYFSVLSNLRVQELPNLFLFLGGNIGNYTKEETVEFLTQVRHRMRPGDKILIGFDLRNKSPSTIQRAYDDSAGVTRAFNMNLLVRIRKELSMDLVLENFQYYSCYNPGNGEVRNFLVSLCPQIVFSKILNTSFQFKTGETIAVELAQKYSLDEIASLAASLEFNLVEHFLDSKQYFSDSLLGK
jgi:uncharacterized SAM-dependent methyltransferase